jgi:hypothetical protein
MRGIERIIGVDLEIAGDGDGPVEAVLEDPPAQAKHLCEQRKVRPGVTVVEGQDVHEELHKERELN